MTVRLDLSAARNETWRPTIDLPYLGGPLPLEDASIHMQIRLYEGAPGAALIDVPDIAFTDFAEGSDDEVRILRLEPAIIQSALEGLPTGLNQAEPGEYDTFVWDAIITYSNGTTDRPVAGYFNIEKGTTRDA